MAEEMIQCPYDPTHLIMKSRMPSHLIKCRKQHSTERFVTCPLNSTHDVPETELEYHVKTCPDRKNLEQFVYLTAEPKEVDRRCMDVDLPSCSENWDEESSPSGSYLNVKESVVEKSKVLRVPVGKSKSERREFYKKEVEKFRDNLPEPGGSGDQ